MRAAAPRAATLPRRRSALMLPRFVAPALVLALPCAAQSLEDLRRDLRQRLGEVHFAQALGGLVLASDELELSGAKFDFHDESDTELVALVLPFQRTLRPFADERFGLYLEGAVGHARATQRSSDLYSGRLPGFETAVDTDWSTYSALVGVGLSYDLTPTLQVSAIGDLGLAYLSNDADYSGPGAAVTAAIADGIAFNWDALASCHGTAARVDWSCPLDDERELELIARYDLRWTDTLSSDDPAQDFATRLQWLTLRGDVTGPTGIELLGGQLGWRGILGYRAFLEGDLFGAEDFFQIGGALELAEQQALPLLGGMSLSAGIFVGAELSGWIVGFNVSF